jgi:hypothetical protein
MRVVISTQMVWAGARDAVEGTGSAMILCSEKPRSTVPDSRATGLSVLLREPPVALPHRTIMIAVVVLTFSRRGDILERNFIDRKISRRNFDRQSIRRSSCKD